MVNLVGIFSCFSSNKSFKIISKVKSQDVAKSIIIKEEAFDKEKQEEVKLPDIKDAISNLTLEPE